MVVDAFDKLGVTYYIGGSFASSMYGEPRSTQDVDFVAELREEHVLPLVQLLQDRFYIDEGTVRGAIETRDSFNVIHWDSAYRADVFVKPYDADDQALQRRRLEALGAEPTQAFFASPEDTVLSKLAWYVLGGEVSQKQWRDIVGVLKHQGADLDWQYLQKRALETGVAALLDRARLESGS